MVRKAKPTTIYPCNHFSDKFLFRSSLKSQYSKSTDCNHKMWMQDIFRTDYNATQAVTVDELNCFQMVCLTSAQFLKKTMELNS